MLVGCFKGSNISLPHIILFPKITGTPGKDGPLEYFINNHIRHQAAMPAIAVGKAMNANQTVFKTYGCFIGRVGSLRQPVMKVIKKALQARQYLVFINAQVFIGGTESPGPGPNFAIHLVMQFPDER